MYEELINKLRYCGNAVSCNHCPYWEGCAGSKEDMIEAADAIEELRKAVLRLEDESGIYDELPTFYIYPTKWISVSDRLPSNGTNVLVFEFGRVEQAYTTTYTADRSLCWVVINGGSYHRISDADCPIKWWMPLPEPPKEET